NRLEVFDPVGTAMGAVPPMMDVRRPLRAAACTSTAMLLQGHATVHRIHAVDNIAQGEPFRPSGCFHNQLRSVECTQRHKPTLALNAGGTRFGSTIRTESGFFWIRKEEQLPSSRLTPLRSGTANCSMTLMTRRSSSS